MICNTLHDSKSLWHNEFELQVVKKENSFYLFQGYLASDYINNIPDRNLLLQYENSPTIDEYIKSSEQALY